MDSTALLSELHGGHATRGSSPSAVSANTLTAAISVSQWACPHHFLFAVTTGAHTVRTGMRLGQTPKCKADTLTHTHRTIPTCGSSGQSVLSGLRWERLVTDQRRCREEEGLGRRCEEGEVVFPDHMDKRAGLIDVPCRASPHLAERSSQVKPLENHCPTLTFASGLAAILLCVGNGFHIRLKN